MLKVRQDVNICMIWNKAIVITNGKFGLLCQAEKNSVNWDPPAIKVIKYELLKTDKQEEKIKRLLVIRISV